MTLCLTITGGQLPGAVTINYIEPIAAPTPRIAIGGRTP